MSAPAVPGGGLVDVHCHVLPGVDDGAPDLEASLGMLRAATAGGTAVVVATPHQHPGRYPNEPAPLRAAHRRLIEARQRLVDRGEVLPEILLGAEVHLQDDLPRRVRDGERLTLAGGPYLLLELPDVFAMSLVEELVYELRLADVVPVLAHPERCGGIVREPGRLRRLVGLGALAQVTAASVDGSFGQPCRQLTDSFLRAGLVHAVASDAHDLERRPPSLAAARRRVQELLGDEVARRLFVDNPLALAEGRPVDPGEPWEPEAPPARRGGWLRRLLFRR